MKITRIDTATGEREIRDVEIRPPTAEVIAFPTRAAQPPLSFEEEALTWYCVSSQPLHERRWAAVVAALLCAVDAARKCIRPDQAG